VGGPNHNEPVRDERVRYCVAVSSSVRSRRERPAKPALSREWIVAETIRLMKAEGLEKATMRRVADALDTGPASLYAYVASTTELHAAVLDELIGALTETTVGTAPERLRSLLADYTRIMFSHPGLARSALLMRPSGPNAIVLYDRILGLLIENGLEPGRAAWGVDLLLQHLTANAAEHSAPPGGRSAAARDHSVEQDALFVAVRMADPERTPHVAAYAEELLGGAPEQRARWALDAVLAGIAVTAVPAPDRSAPSDAPTPLKEHTP